MPWVTAVAKSKILEPVHLISIDSKSQYMAISVNVNDQQKTIGPLVHVKNDFPRGRLIYLINLQSKDKEAYLIHKLRGNKSLKAMDWYEDPNRLVLKIHSKYPAGIGEEFYEIRMHDWHTKLISSWPDKKISLPKRIKVPKWLTTEALNKNWILHHYWESNAPKNKQAWALVSGRELSFPSIDKKFRSLYLINAPKKLRHSQLKARIQRWDLAKDLISTKNLIQLGK